MDRLVVNVSCYLPGVTRRCSMMALKILRLPKHNLTLLLMSIIVNTKNYPSLYAVDESRFNERKSSPTLYRPPPSLLILT